MPLTLVSALRGKPDALPPSYGDTQPPGGHTLEFEPVPGLDALPARGLGTVAARSAAVLRLAWCVVTLVVVYGSGAVAAPSPWRETLVFGAIAWSVIAAAVCWRGYLPFWLVIGDVAVCSGLLVAMVRLLPAPMVGVAGSWVLGWAGVSVLLTAWRLRASIVWLVAFVEVGAYLLGSWVAGERTGSDHPLGLARGLTETLQAIGLLLAVAAIGLTLVRLVRLGAADASTTMRRWDAARRDDEIEEARLHDRGARRLLLHDTVLTTLTAISRGGLHGRAHVVRDRCAHDMEALGRDPDAIDPIRTGEQLIAVARRQAVHRGLDVEVIGESPTNQLPAEVAAAFGAAVREALSNIEKHAGTSEVRMGIRGNEEYLEIVVQDPGRGFDSTNPSSGLGLRRSLTGRMTAIGGSATIESAPGRGTSITLRWTADARPAPRSLALAGAAPRAAATTSTATATATLVGGSHPATSGAGPALASASLLRRAPSTSSGTGGNHRAVETPRRMLSAVPGPGERLVGDRYTRFGQLALAWIGHLWQALSLALLVANWSQYRSGVVALLGWFVLFLVTLIQIYLVTFGGDGRYPAEWIDRHAHWMAPLSIVTALVILADCTGPGLLTPANWPIAALGWILTVFAVKQARWFDVGWLAVAVATLSLVWLSDIPAHDLAIALGVVFGAGIPQVGALAIVLELRHHAGVTAAAIAAEQKLEAARAARAAVTVDRAERDATLNRELTPLLQALADGRADPDDPAVRRYCELAAAGVRALVDHDDLTTPIATLDAVATVTRSARQRDVVPIVELGEGLDAVSSGWQRTFTQLADRLLAESLPGEATLTVRGQSDAIAVTLCFPTRTPARQLESVAVGTGRALVPDRRIHVDVEPDTTNIAWLEVTWETRTAA